MRTLTAYLPQTARLYNDDATLRDPSVPPPSGALLSRSFLAPLVAHFR